MKIQNDGRVPWFVPYLGLVGLLAFHIMVYPNSPGKDLYTKTTLWALFSVMAANIIWYALVVITAWGNRIVKWWISRKPKPKPVQAGGYIPSQPESQGVGKPISKKDPEGLVSQWLEAKCRRKAGGRVNMTPLRGSFEHWCKAHGKPINSNNRWFPGVLKDLGVGVDVGHKEKGEPSHYARRYAYGVVLK